MLEYESKCTRVHDKT